MHDWRDVFQRRLQLGPSAKTLLVAGSVGFHCRKNASKLCRGEQRPGDAAVRSQEVVMAAATMAYCVNSLPGRFLVLTRWFQRWRICIQTWSPDLSSAGLGHVPRDRPPDRLHGAWLVT